MMSAWFDGEVTLLPFPSLPLGWVCFWPAVSQAFVVRHDLGFVDAYSGRWMVQVPDVFLYLTLGSSLSLPVLPTSVRWWRFLLGCPPSVASLWRGLPWFLIRYWLGCCASGLLGSVTYLRSVGVLPQSPTVTLLPLLWLGLLLVLVRFRYLRLPL